MANILLTGASGQLGTQLQKYRSFICPDLVQFDLLDQGRVARCLKDIQPDLIIHAAAYTNTHNPEREPQDAYLCYLTNVVGTRYIVQSANCPIIYISTETVLHPYNFYALTKFQGENEIKRHDKGYTIIRTSFRERPFEYDMAFIDMLTIGDYVDVVAPLINNVIDLPIENKTIYVGTGLKSPYQLAVQTKPQVKAIKIKDTNFLVASMTELLNI